MGEDPEAQRRELCKLAEIIYGAGWRILLPRHRGMAPVTLWRWEHGKSPVDQNLLDLLRMYYLMGRRYDERSNDIVPADPAATNGGNR